MSIEPKRQRTAPSGPRGKNLYEKMEEARTRRAEALAQKQPANNDARLPAKKTKAPKPSKAIEAPPSQHESTQEPRFPDIVMPPVPETQAEQNARPVAWRLPAVTLLLALLMGALYMLPQDGNPVASISVTAPTAPDEMGSARTPTSEAPSDRATSNPTLAPSSKSTGALPKVGSTPLRPSVFEPAKSGTVKDASDEAAPKVLASFPFWQPTVRPTSPLYPEADALFVLPQVVELRIALIIPALASEESVRTVAAALDASGYQINPPRLVSYVVRETQVRYYHQGDAPAAIALAQDIGGAARNFTDYRPSPPRGLVEVFVAGRAPARPVSRGLAGGLREFSNDVRAAINAITR